MEQFERDFKGIWIPKEIWLNQDLSMTDKIIFAEIDSLSKADGCYASNEYLAKFCGCSERSVSGSIANLLKLGYIKKVSFDGRTRVLRSCFAYVSTETSRNCEPQSHNLQHINIVNNIERDIKETDISSLHSDISKENPPKRFKKPTIDEVAAYCRERKNSVDPEAFVAYYESKGWMVGRSPMKDWKQAVITFEKNQKRFGSSDSSGARRNGNSLDPHRKLEW